MLRFNNNKVFPIAVTNSTIFKTSKVVHTVKYLTSHYLIFDNYKLTRSSHCCTFLSNENKNSIFFYWPLGWGKRFPTGIALSLDQSLVNILLAVLNLLTSQFVSQCPFSTPKNF